MEIIDEFAAEFQIELAAELADALQNLFRLQLQIFLVVKSHCPHRFFLP